MAIHQVSAVFATRAEAERIGRVLVSELNIPYRAVLVNPLGHEPPTSYDTSNLWDASATGPAGSFFLTEENRRAYLEELRRGRMQLTAMVDESDVAQATHLLEHSGALALYDDEHELRHAPQSHPQASAMASAPFTAVPDSQVAVREAVVSVSEARPAVLTETVRRRSSRVRSYPAG